METTSDSNEAELSQERVRPGFEKSLGMPWKSGILVGYIDDLQALE